MSHVSADLHLDVYLCRPVPGDEKGMTMKKRNKIFGEAGTGSRFATTLLATSKDSKKQQPLCFLNSDDGLRHASP